MNVFLVDTFHATQCLAYSAIVMSFGCVSVSQPSLTAPSTQFTRSTQPLPPPSQGSYDQIRAGDTLWRIAHLYGLEPSAIAQANHLSSTGRLTIGRPLFIPLPRESGRFVWPIRGTPQRTTTTVVEILAPNGSVVRASRSGRVAVATRDLSGLGKTIVLDHLDGYLTVYAGLDQLLVSPGAFLRQGMPVGSLGVNALHFEIRYGTSPRNTLALLPR